MAYGAGLFLVIEAVTLALIPPLLDPARPSFPFLRILEEACFFAANIVPLTAMAFSAAEYRLWDVDRIIGRSLVYGVLTAFLAGAFGVAFFAVRGVLLAIFGVGDSSARRGWAVRGLRVRSGPAKDARLLDRHFWGIGVDYRGPCAPSLCGRTAARAGRHVRLLREPLAPRPRRDGRGLRGLSPRVRLGGRAQGDVPEVANEPDMRARFHLEARSLEQMDHPNIVPFPPAGRTTWR